MKQFSDSLPAHDEAINLLLKMGEEFLKFNRQIKSSTEHYETAIQEGIDKMQNIVSQAQFIFTEAGQNKFNDRFGIDNSDNEPFCDFISAVQKFFSCQSISRATKIELRDVLSGFETKEELETLSRVESYKGSFRMKIEHLEKIEPSNLVRKEFPLNLKRNQNAVQKLSELILGKLDLPKGDFCKYKIWKY